MSGAVDSSPVPLLDAPLVGNAPVGAYRRLTFRAPSVAAHAVPGTFLAVAVGGPASAALLRRCFSIAQVDEGAGTVDLVVAAAGPGTQWLTTLPAGAGMTVSLAGPLGHPFPLPDDPDAGCVLVGGGYGGAPLPWLGQALRERGCRVELVLGAASADRLCGVDEARGAGLAVTVTTDDGSAGPRGWVSDVLPDAIARMSGFGAPRVYGCGPMPMLRSVSSLAAEAGCPAYVAVEESMACGVGVCMTCVLPVRDADGATRMVRSCLEGPVFAGDQVRWDAFRSGWGRVPDDAVGAAPPPRERVVAGEPVA